MLAALRLTSDTHSWRKPSKYSSAGVTMANLYILDGKIPVPCDETFAWGKWYETANRTVAYSEIGSVEISTVFLGINHAFGGDLPILFETMIFGGKKDGYQERYRTWEEAEDGHLRAVAIARCGNDNG